MRSPKLLPIALLVASTLTACALSPKPVSAPPKPLPAELAVPCPPPAEAPGPEPDAALLALKTLYDQYGACAGRFVDLLNWLQAPPTTMRKEQP